MFKVPLRQQDVCCRMVYELKTELETELPEVAQAPEVANFIEEISDIAKERYSEELEALRQELVPLVRSPAFQTPTSIVSTPTCSC